MLPELIPSLQVGTISELCACGKQVSQKRTTIFLHIPDFCEPDMQIIIKKRKTILEESSAIRN